MPELLPIQPDDCFANFIGIAPNCKDALPPRTGYYINDLEGISLQSMAAIVNGEDRNGRALMEQKIAFAVGMVKEELRQFLRPYFRIDRKTAITPVGQQNASWAAVAVSPEPLYRGLRLRHYSQGMQRMLIETVTLLVKDDAPALTLQILDGTRILERPVALQGGQPLTLRLDYKCKNEHVYILLDNSLVETNLGQISSSLSGSYCFECGGRRRVRERNAHAQDFKATGWDGGQETGNTYGVTAEVSLYCEEEPLLCSLAPALGTPCLYRAGIELMNEWLMSERLNKFTTYRAEQAAAVRDRWIGEYQARMRDLGPTFTQALSQYDKNCITCNTTQYLYGI